MILGDTGSGKSTLVNYLLGCKLIEKDNLGYIPVIDLEDDENGFSKIGHSIDVSETEGFSIHSNGDEILTLLDTQGFFDSRGVDYQIAFSLLFDKIREKCKSLKFIMTFDCKSFITTRMAGVKKNFGFFQDLFVKKMYLEKYVNSILILITKIDPKVKIERLKKHFSNSDNEVLRILENRVFFYDPLNSSSNGVLRRKEFLNEIYNMVPIKEKVLDVPFSVEEKYFFKNLFSVFKHDVSDKAQNNKYLDILGIYGKLGFFQQSKIIFIKNWSKILMIL